MTQKSSKLDAAREEIRSTITHRREIGLDDVAAGILTYSELLDRLYADGEINALVYVQLKEKALRLQVSFTTSTAHRNESRRRRIGRHTE